MIKKNMKLGMAKFFLFIFLLIFSIAKAEEKITTIPLINLENLEPSYEEIERENENTTEILNNDIKNKSKKKNDSVSASINILGLDKITAKTTKINIKIGESKKFGILEIKAIKCGKLKSKNEPGEAAYIQIKDLSDNLNEKVFVFNGWTFSSSPSLRPIDHPVYDIWLINCENV
tara:strand:+ start:1221 stop:1745 length:525 start_codon:yes stop_codon:yes gene_type:complete